MLQVETSVFLELTCESGTGVRRWPKVILLNQGDREPGANLLECQWDLWVGTENDGVKVEKKYDRFAYTC